MANPYYTPLFLVGAGLLVMSSKQWKQRWIGFLISMAGFNELSMLTGEDAFGGVALYLGLIVFALILFFEPPKKTS